METHYPHTAHLISDCSRGAGLPSALEGPRSGRLLADRVGSNGSALLTPSLPRQHERASVDLHVDTMLVLVLLLQQARATAL